MANLSLPLDPPHPSTCTLYHGDCLDVMPTLAPGSVHMMFADLPYGAAKNSSWDRKIDLSRFWCRSKTLQVGQAVTALTATQPFATELIESNKKSFRYDLVWDKARGANIGLLKIMPLRTHEGVYIFADRIKTYNPQMWQGVGSTLRSQKYAYKKSKHVGLNARKAVMSGNASGVRHPVSIIRAPLGCQQHSVHPTQKPVDLLEWLIATYTNLGDTVLDPVFGSGTTAIACARLGRNFVGIEKDKTYFDVARARIDAERASLGLTPSTHL